MQGGGHEDDAEVGIGGQHVADEDERKVCEAVALVDLVHDQVRDVGQGVGAGGQHAQQDAVGGEEERGVAPAAALQPDVVPDVDPGGLAALRGDALRAGHGGDAAGLGAEHVAAAPRRPRVLQQVLRHLRGLATPRLAADQDHAVCGHRRQQLRAMCGHGQRCARRLQRGGLGAGDRGAPRRQARRHLLAGHGRGGVRRAARPRGAGPPAAGGRDPARAGRVGGREVSHVLRQRLPRRLRQVQRDGAQSGGALPRLTHRHRTVVPLPVGERGEKRAGGH